MQVSGVRSSWETLATNSLRTRSSRRSSVTSWSTSRTPGAPGPSPSGRAARRDDAVHGGPQLELVPRAGDPAARTSLHQIEEPLLPDHLEEGAALGAPVLHAEHRTGRRVEQEDAASVVQRDHALDHAVEDRAHLGLLVGQALDLLAERHGRPVERDPERRDLVVARDRHRLREVALGHAPGRVPPSPGRAASRAGSRRARSPPPPRTPGAPRPRRWRGPAPGRRRRPGSARPAGAPRAGGRRARAAPPRRGGRGRPSRSGARRCRLPPARAWRTSGRSAWFSISRTDSRSDSARTVPSAPITVTRPPRIRA